MPTKVKNPGKEKREFKVPATMTSAHQIDALIKQLQALRGEISDFQTIEIIFKVDGK